LLQEVIGCRNCCSMLSTWYNIISVGDL
jgi:hypothetical protein